MAWRLHQLGKWSCPRSSGCETSRTLRARVKEGAKVQQARGGQHQSCGAGGAAALALGREGGTISTCTPHPKHRPPHPRRCRHRTEGRLARGQCNRLSLPLSLRSSDTNWSDTSVILVTQTDPGLSQCYHGVSRVIYVREKVPPCPAGQ